MEDERGRRLNVDLNDMPRKLAGSLNDNPAFTHAVKACYLFPMKTETVEIPAQVLSSVETLDELQDWLTAQNSTVMSELRAARREDKAGKFKIWKPRHSSCVSGSK